MIKPKRIIHNGNATIVFWNDNTKTVVRCAEDGTQDNYNAFCAAYCKKVFGSNSHLKRVIKDAENAKPEKVKKHKDLLDVILTDYYKHKTMELKKELLKCHRLLGSYCICSEELPIPKKFTMPGCVNCTSVDNCSDCYSSNAVSCNNYDDPYGFL